jgi:hypothetical protein
MEIILLWSCIVSFLLSPVTFKVVIGTPQGDFPAKIISSSTSSPPPPSSFFFFTLLLFESYYLYLALNVLMFHFIFFKAPNTCFQTESSNTAS